MKKHLPRTREDWSFLFHLGGIVGNIIFWAIILFGANAKPKVTPTPPPAIHVIVIDSAYAHSHFPVIYNSQLKQK
jgi:hypothetical protein